jgi:sterol desaturase/sphingolipid hydroxylase (fatty acid hydroxylase superfamily)
VDYILVTPAFHALHHDRNTEMQNANFGGVLSIWDRMFKTYKKETTTIIPGITGYERYNIFLIQIDPILFFLRKKLFKGKK